MLGDIGDEVEEPEAEAAPTKRKYTKRAPATAANRQWNGEAPSATPQRKKGAKACRACGEVGHMAKTCGRQAAPKPTDGKMSQMTFGRVKIAQSHELPLDEVARNLDLITDDVDRAFDAEDYDAYLKS